MMRKIIGFLSLTLILSLLLSGCRQIETSEGSESTTESPGVTIVYPEADGRMVVCLDAGHGFGDIGCDTDLLSGTESDVTLDVVMMVKAELEKNGVEVILTHDGVTYPSEQKIMDLADKAGVAYNVDRIVENNVFSAYERSIYVASIADDEAIDLFVSLHVNSIDDYPTLSRYEIDYYSMSPYRTSLEIFSNSLFEMLDNETIIYADPFDEAFLVTKTGDHAAVLVEMGYATNVSDAEKLNSQEWRKTFSKNLSDCIVEWIETYEKK